MQRKKSEAAAARVVCLPFVRMRERGKKGSGKRLYSSTDPGIQLHGLVSSVAVKPLHYDFPCYKPLAGCCSDAE